VFHDIPPEITERMRVLEEIDARDKLDGTPRLERLRQIPAETGRFLAILAAGAPPGRIVEIGTSAGYSTLWLALACRPQHRTITTFENSPAKAALARETFRVAGVDDIVELVADDALQHLPGLQGIAFCFLDPEKELYGSCYEEVVPNLVPGGLLVADNSINRRTTLQPMIDRAFADRRVDVVDVPIGMGELVCRRAVD
jgi:predicted O-methyltransferase YrrM